MTESKVPSSMSRNECVLFGLWDEELLLLASCRLWFSSTARAEEWTSRKDICTVAMEKRSSSPSSQASDVLFSKSWNGSRLLLLDLSSFLGELHKTSFVKTLVNPKEISTMALYSQNQSIIPFHDLLGPHQWLYVPRGIQTAHTTFVLLSAKSLNWLHRFTSAVSFAENTKLVSFMLKLNKILAK